MRRRAGSVRSGAVIDLHCHSTCSDGTDSPATIARLAADAGLSGIALTDHDTLEGFDEFAAGCAARGVRAVRGAEISCLDEGRSTHVLCYFVSDDPSSALCTLLATLHGDRDRRNELLVARLHELGYDRVTLDEVRREAGGTEEGSLGRPHFASAIDRLYPGRFESRQAIFDGLLGTGGGAYIQKARVSVAEASAAAAADGAVTVLAHPLITVLSSLPDDQRTLDVVEARIAPLLSRLADDGLVGVECWYPRHGEAETELLRRLASESGLVATGGSDYHGANKPGLSVGTGTGSLRVPDDVLDALEARRP